MPSSKLLPLSLKLALDEVSRIKLIFPCIMGNGPRIGPLRAGANGQFWADDQINGTGPHY